MKESGSGYAADPVKLSPAPKAAWSPVGGTDAGYTPRPPPSRLTLPPSRCPSCRVASVISRAPPSGTLPAPLACLLLAPVIWWMALRRNGGVTEDGGPISPGTKRRGSVVDLITDVADDNQMINYEGFCTVADEMQLHMNFVQKKKAFSKLDKMDGSKDGYLELAYVHGWYI